MTFILLLILLVLVFGSGWLRGALRAICMFAAAAVALGLVVNVFGVDPQTVIYAGFAVLGIAGTLDAAARAKRRARLARRRKAEREARKG